MNPLDWWPCFDAATGDADALSLAAAALGVPEERIEILRTGGAVLARERWEETNVSNI